MITEISLFHNFLINLTFALKNGKSWSTRKRERCKQINFQLDTILSSEKNLFSRAKGHHLNIRRRYSIFHIYSQNEEKWEFSPFVTSNVRRKAPHNIKPEREREKCSVTFENLLFHPTLFAPRKRSVRVAFHRVLVFRKAEIRFSRNTIATDSYDTRWWLSFAIYRDPLSNIWIIPCNPSRPLFFRSLFYLFTSRDSPFPRFSTIYRFLGDELCWFLLVLFAICSFFSRVFVRYFEGIKSTSQQVLLWDEQDPKLPACLFSLLFTVLVRTPITSSFSQDIHSFASSVTHAEKFQKMFSNVRFYFFV